MPSTLSVASDVKRASPISTDTFSASSASIESTGAIVSIARCTDTIAERNASASHSLAPVQPTSRTMEAR